MLFWDCFGGVRALFGIFVFGGGGGLLCLNCLALVLGFVWGVVLVLCGVLFVCYLSVVC